MYHAAMKHTGQADNRHKTTAINGYWFYFTPPASLVGMTVCSP